MRWKYPLPSSHNLSTCLAMNAQKIQRKPFRSVAANTIYDFLFWQKKREGWHITFPNTTPWRHGLSPGLKRPMRKVDGKDADEVEVDEHRWWNTAPDRWPMQYLECKLWNTTLTYINLICKVCIWFVIYLCIYLSIHPPIPLYLRIKPSIWCSDASDGTRYNMKPLGWFHKLKQNEVIYRILRLFQSTKHELNDQQWTVCVGVLASKHVMT